MTLTRRTALPVTKVRAPGFTTDVRETQALRVPRFQAPVCDGLARPSGEAQIQDPGGRKGDLGTRFLCHAADDLTVRGVYGCFVSKQALGNALAGVLFLIIAVVDLTRDSSGIGVVFLVFSAVFLGLASSARKAASPPS
jgi:hypothetical protein